MNIAIANTPQAVLSETMHDIQTYYIKPVSEQYLLNQAMQGMLNGLDTHCTYMTGTTWDNIHAMTVSQFAGIGLEVTMKNGALCVVNVLDGTPAQKSGIQAGDKIIKLNDQSITGWTLRSAVDEMRGPVGSKITLDVMHDAMHRAYILKREMIHMQSVSSRLLGNYAYIKIAQFQSSTLQEVRAAVQALKASSTEPIQGLIIDLRNNPGGLFTSGVAVANVFIDGKTQAGKSITVIVSTRGRAPGANAIDYATPGDIIQKIPIVVLVNHESASASEIVAGALKDNHRAVIVGTQTFGKGSVQTLIPLNQAIGQESAIKLTTALYYTPLGISIQGVGITPDILAKSILFNEQLSQACDVLKDYASRG